MKRILMTLAMTFFSISIMQAQSERIPADLPMTSVHPFQFISVQGQAPQESDTTLPDAPIPVLPGLQDGPLPCPAGIGKPCPLLGGRLYFRDPSHMTEHDATWGQAMRNPMMMVGGLANLASTIADIEGTEACLRSHTCTEGDPLFGSNPSRVKSYGIGIPITFVVYAVSAWLKKNGDGNMAFGILWGGTMLHTFEAAHGFAVAGKGATAKPSSPAVQRLGLVLRF